MGKPLVYVCEGSDCRDERRALRKLLDSLDGVAEVERVRCQKICDGPVAGTEVDGTLEWFEELDSKKLREALVELLGGGMARRRLLKQRVGKRQGKLRR